MRTVQILELRAYCAARGWTIAREFVDAGISGSKTSRPALDELMQTARRRQIDAVVVWKLDRLGRSLQHLIEVLNGWTEAGIAFVSLGGAIDMTTSAGRLQMQLLGAFAEFERSRIRERVHAGLARARKQGKKLGRRRQTALPSDAPRGFKVLAPPCGVARSQRRRAD